MSNFNKVVTNIPVSLTETEMSNLSQTLSGIIQGGGGGGEGKRYIGDGVYVTVNNDANPGIIALTQTSLEKLNKEIPSAVSSFPDSIQYAKKTYVDNTFQTKDAMSAYWTSAETNAAFAEQYTTLVEQINEKQNKLTFAYDNDKISAINGSALAGQGGGTGDYTAGTDLKIENNIISVNTNGNPNNTANNTRNFVEGSWTEASGYNSHAEGMATTAYGYAVHAQGMWTKFSSSKWWDNEHPTPIDIYWADGAGATVEGYCNATTSCPMSGNEGGSDYGPIHGGVLKVIGNGNVVHDTSVDPDAHIHTLHPSDALIIFKDGTISAFGDIFNNGKKYVTEDSISSYNVTAQQGVEVTPTYDSTNKTITFGISITSTPVVTDTTLNGYNGIAAAKDGDVSGQWNVGLTNDMLNTINGKLDTSDFNTYTGTTAPSTYQPKGDYLSSNALEGYATQQWVGQQGYITQETDWTNTIQEASAKAYNDATANANSLYQTKGDYVKNTDIGLDSNNKVTAISGKELIITAHQSLTNYYTKSDTSSKNELSTEFAKYLTTAQYNTDSATFALKSDLNGLVNSASVTTNDNYVMTNTGWKVLTLPGGGMTQVIHDDTLTGQGNDANSKLGLSQTAYNAITSVSSKLDTTAFSNVSGTFLTKSSADNDYAPKSVTADVNTLTAASAGWNNKVDKPNTSFVNNYLALRTDNAGNVSGWVDLKDNFYSKSEATGTFVATANIDTTTLSGDGKSVSTKLGVKTNVIATKDYVSGNYLPLSGGTVSGSVKFSAASGQNVLAVASAASLLGASRQTSSHYGVDNTALGTTWMGVGGDGMHQGFIKYTDGGNVGALDSNSTIQLNFKPSTNKFDSVQVQINGNPVGYLIPAVTSNTTAGLTNDGILHIILES